MSFLLPSTERSGDRVKRFGKGMEKATIFCLAEIGRNKGGLIRKKPPEEIVFISRVCYPVWRVPWGEVALLFDGLGLRKYTASFDMSPDIDVFVKEVEANAEKTEAYLNFVMNNLDYFRSFIGQGKKVIDGLIASPAFLKDFKSYQSKARRVKGSPPETIMLSPFMDRDAVESSVKGLSEMRDNLKKDLSKLDKTVKTLIRLTDRHVKILAKKNEEIREEAEEEIARFRTRAFMEIEQMRKGYDNRILEAQKNAEGQLSKLQEELTQLDDRRTRLATYAKKCETEKANCEGGKDEAGLDSWKKELRKCTEELVETEKNVSSVEGSMRDVERARDVETSDIEAEFDTRSEAIMAGLKRVEDARDAKIASNEHKTKTLKDSTLAFIDQINRLIDLRKSAIADLKRVGMPEARREYAMMYVPFFLVCYEQDINRRYALFPPSLVHGMSGMTKIKSVLKASKVTAILDDRSEAIRKFLNLFLELVRQNPIFEEKLVGAGTKTNILGTSEDRENMAEGLESLMSEGWLSESDYQSFKDRLNKA